MITPSLAVDGIVLVDFANRFLTVAGPIVGVVLGSWLTQQGARTARQEQAYQEKLEELYGCVLKIYRANADFNDEILKAAATPGELDRLSKQRFSAGVPEEIYERAIMLSELYFPSVKESLDAAKRADRQLLSQASYVKQRETLSQSATVSDVSSDDDIRQLDKIHDWAVESHDSYKVAIDGILMLSRNLVPHSKSTKVALAKRMTKLAWWSKG